MSIIKCEVIIDASLEEVAAYEFVYMSRQRVKLNDTEDILHRDATNINNHALDCINIREFGSRLAPRLWLTRQLWLRVNEN